MKFLIFASIVFMFGCKQPPEPSGIKYKEERSKYFVVVCIDGVEYIVSRYDSYSITPKLKKDGSISICEE